ncbi:MAG: DUF3775 domain-containing protein [Pseudomonadota bacterium]
MLTIPLTTLAWIVQRSREFDVKEAPSGLVADGDESPFAVLEARDADTQGRELQAWIGDLTEVQQAELVALFWLGRHGGSKADFLEYFGEAEGQQGKRTAAYLMGSPHLADHLESGLEALGYAASDLEIERL